MRGLSQEMIRGATAEAADVVPDPDGLELAGRFVEVMARVCAPVSVVTALDHGHPHGTTVSAFASLSVSPPMMLVALAHSSELLALVRRSKRFGVNVLGAQMTREALCFSGKGRDKFDAVDWCMAEGLPRLPTAHGWLACDLAGEFHGGDHLILVGRVTAAEWLRGEPLIYYQRAFGTHRSV